MEGIPAWVGDASTVAVALAFISAIFGLLTTGKIVTKNTMDTIISQYDKIIESKDKTISSLEKQNAYLLDASTTTKHAITSLQAAGQQQGAVISDD